MKLRFVAIELYQQFISSFYSLEEYSIKDRVKANQVIVNFLIEIHKRINLNSIGPRFIFYYLIFQFDYWNSKDVSFGDKVNIVRIFGKKSIERYFNRSKDYSWYNAELSLNSLGIKQSFLNEYDQVTVVDRVKIDEKEEKRKEQYFGTKSHLVNCMDNTTLFNHRSIHCAICTHKTICKKILKENYFSIYVDRGYEENSIE